MWALGVFVLEASTTLEVSCFTSFLPLLCLNNVAFFLVFSEIIIIFDNRIAIHPRQ